MNLNQLEEKLNSLNSTLSSLEGQHNLLTRQISGIEDKLKELSHKREIYVKSVELLTIIQEFTKQKIRGGFENLVTFALRYIFNDDYKFELSFDRRGNLQEVDFKIIAPEREEASDPLDSSGGGVLDVVSIALRIVLLELSRPKIEGFIALDESFKHVSSQYLENCANFLNNINQKVNRQIILVTHQNELTKHADKVIDLNKEE